MGPNTFYVFIREMSSTFERKDNLKNRVIYENKYKWTTSNQYKIPLNYTKLTDQLSISPVTMIVPASGHQVRCIPWVQMGTLNKEIGFLCGLKFFTLSIFCVESTFDVANMVKTVTVKDVPINDEALLNMQAC